jgi:lipopolysaccharide transport system ATP-binding protein
VSGLLGSKRQEKDLPMCSDIAIKVMNLHKCFYIYDKPRDRFKQFVFPLTQSLLRLQTKKYYREFWALESLSFEIKKGEIVGIIGRNGAGKSTLLQLICGILAPTTGDVMVNGRVAALLELGAGFNPEFNGKENVYLNGSVLGLTKQEIDEKYSEIIEFADIGDFIDQPVKTYSSGMYVRLAFAVQACIDPDILIIDEALAVGDIGFQYKCFRRIESLRAKGTTILMVTHSSGSILEYADRCIVLDKGRVLIDTTDVLSAVLTYEKGMIARNNDKHIGEATTEPSKVNSHEDLIQFQKIDANKEIGERRFGTARAIIKDFNILRTDGSNYLERPIVKSGEELRFVFSIASSESIENVALGISLSKVQGNDVWGDNNQSAGFPIALKAGYNTIEYTARVPLSAGEYLVHCGLSCTVLGKREELDQRRPLQKIRYWTPREQVGILYAPITIELDKS